MVSTYLTQEDLAETPTAAPAARRRLCFMSWKAGGGARQLPTDVLEEKAYDFFAIQEAHVEQMLQLEDIHMFVLEENNALLSASRTGFNADPMSPQGRYRGWWQTFCLMCPAWGSLPSWS